MEGSYIIKQIILRIFSLVLHFFAKALSSVCISFKNGLNFLKFINMAWINKKGLRQIILYRGNL